MLTGVMHMEIVDVSIVLCSYNRPEMLRDALQSLVAQETNGSFRYEIVIVYGGEVAPTVDVVNEVAQQTEVPIRAIHEPRPGQVIARNRAIEEAQGAWLAHFDDDQIADPSWLKELLATAGDHKVLVVGGAVLLKLPERCDRQLAPHCQRLLGSSVNWDTVRPYTRKQGPGTGSELIHRSVFDDVGMFDESFQLRGYDTELYRKMREAGFEAWFTPRAIAYHVTPASRLEEEYFRETALHNGWSFARRDFLEWGIAKTAAVGALRLGQSALWHFPRLIISRLFRLHEDAMAWRSRLWHTEGFIRCVLYELAPKVFAQRQFFSRYEFRPEKSSKFQHDAEVESTEWPSPSDQSSVGTVCSRTEVFQRKTST